MEHAPVAVIVNNGDREVTYANSNWFDLTEHPRCDDFSKLDWTTAVYEEDIQAVHNVWEELLLGEPIQVEFRLRALWKGGDGRQSYKWVQAMVWPELDANGVLKQA